METIYYGALEQSMELSIDEGYYDSFPGSPFSMGILQFDLWNVTPSDRWDWNDLKNIKLKSMELEIFINCSYAYCKYITILW